jgi:hypothetical protein
MGWKTINGRQYYYRSVREGGRVRSEYIGTGRLAKLCSGFDETNRQVRKDRRFVERFFCDRTKEVFKAIDELIGEARRAAADALTAAGFHQHKRQWRRKRDKRSREGGPQTRTGAEPLS